MPIQVITVGLSTNTPSILKNNTATINCTVNGLNNLDLKNNNFKVVLTNESPKTISFAGNSATQFNHELSTGNIEGGTTNFSVNVTGNRSGAYTVSAAITSTTCTSCWRAYEDCIDRSDKEETRCINDCNKNNGGWACIVKCWAAARAREIQCWTDYLDCIRKKFGY